MLVQITSRYKRFKPKQYLNTISCKTLPYLFSELKEAGRINIIKDPATLEIINITIADAEQITNYILSLSIQ